MGLGIVSAGVSAVVVVLGRVTSLGGRLRVGLGARARLGVSGAGHFDVTSIDRSAQEGKWCRQKRSGSGQALPRWTKEGPMSNHVKKHLRIDGEILSQLLPETGSCNCRKGSIKTFNNIDMARRHATYSLGSTCKPGLCV